MHARLIACAAAVAALTVARPAAADFVNSTTGSFEQVVASNTYQQSSTVICYDGFFLPNSPVVGVSRFDPALGTLIGVTITADFAADWQWAIDLTGDTVLDEQSDAEVNLELELIQFFIGYANGGSTSVLLAENEAPLVNAYASAGEGDPFTSDGNGDLLVGPTDITGIVDLNDFIGVGDVDSLGAYIAYPSGAVDYSLTNLADAFADLNATFGGAGITLEYEYIPVPEPTSLALVGGASLAALRRRPASRIG